MTVYQQGQTPTSLFDALYCEEDNFEDEEESHEKQSQVNENGLDGSTLVHLILELERDCFIEDNELIALFLKEKKQGISKQGSCCDVSGRKEVVEWMLMVNNHFGFSTLTSVLSVNYLDRFLTCFHLHNDKPWSLQLAAVACLSLAAKIEETFVPLLLDLQIEGTKYMFEAKNIQKMELLVLSILEWKMHPVTPISFLDHIIRRLGLKHHLHWEFMRRCERLLLSLLSDGRFAGCLPSVLATATMMHVIHQIDAYNALDYHNQLMGVLKINKEKVNECYQLIKELFSTLTTSTRIEFNDNNSDGSSKRKWEQMMMMINENTGSTINNSRQSSGSTSPSGVIDASYNYLNSCESSDDSWAASATTTTTAISCHINNNNDIAMSLSSSSSSSSLSRKKGRLMVEHQLPMVFFVDLIGTP